MNAKMDKDRLPSSMAISMESKDQLPHGFVSMTAMNGGISSYSIVNVQDSVVFFRPPDGGYGWVIVAVSFMFLLLSEGLIYSFGTFYEDIEVVFQCDSRTPAVIIGAMFMGISGIIGPLVAGISNRFGFRPIALFSGTSISVIFFLTAFAPSIEVFVGLLGFLGGATFTGLILPAYSMFSQWFDKNRALACSLVYGGSGVGCLFYPHLIEYLIMNYTMRGCLIIISAIYLNFIPLALLIKDPMDIVQRTVDHEIIMPDKSTQSIEGISKSNILSNNSLFRSEEHNMNKYRSCSFTKNASSRNTLNKSSHSVYSSHVGIIPTLKVEENFYQETDLPCIEQTAYAALINKTIHGGSHANMPSVNERNIVSSLATIRSNPDTKEYKSIIKAVSKEFARPFYQEKYLPTVSFDPAPSSKRSLTYYDKPEHQEDSGEPINTVVITKQDIEHPMLSVIQDIFQLELLRLPPFYLLMIISFSMCIITLSLSQTMKNYSNFIDMTRLQFSYFVFIFGIGLVLSKPIFGFWMNKTRHWEVIFLLAAIIMAFSTFIIGYISRMEYVITFGFILSTTSSCVTNLRSLLITRYIPRNLVTSVFGWAFFFGGLSMALVPFIALIGSKYFMFNLSFGLYAFTALFAGIMAMLLLLTKNVPH